MPIEIISQNTRSVTFRVTNTYSTKTVLYTQFHEIPTGDTECFEEESVEPVTQSIEYTAYCMHNVPISIVDLWFVGDYLEGEGDNAEIPPCCHPTSPTSNPAVQAAVRVYLS